jgi:hypothetical protein
MKRRDLLKTIMAAPLAAKTFEAEQERINKGTEILTTASDREIERATRGAAFSGGFHPGVYKR